MVLGCGCLWASQESFSDADRKPRRRVLVLDHVLNEIVPNLGPKVVLKYRFGDPFFSSTLFPEVYEAGIDGVCGVCGTLVGVYKKSHTPYVTSLENGD